MKRFIFTILIFTLVGLCTLSAQSYNQMWEEIEQAEKEGKPQTAISTAQKIFMKAQQERLAPQMMRAYLTAMAHRKHLSIDSLYVDIKELEDWASNPITSVNDAAILHSLLGSIYTNSARGKYTNQVIAELPEDMSEWTRLMYYQRAFDHFMTSVSRLEELRKYSTHDYSPIMFYGVWSNYYDHDMMHLIGRRAAFGIRDIENQLSRAYKQTEWKSFTLDYEQFRKDTLTPISAYDCPTQVMRIFQRMLSLINPDEQPDGWIFMELNRLNVIPEYLKNDETYDEHLSLLYRMKERFNTSELCGCIFLDIAKIYQRQQKYPEALEALREGMKKYPTYKGVNLLYNMENEILQPYFYMFNIEDSYFYPEESLQLSVRHRNLNHFTIWLRSVDCPFDTLQKYYNQPEELKKYSKFHSEHKFQLENHAKLLQKDTIVNLTLPHTNGVYLIESLANGKGSNLSMLYLSPFQILELQQPGNITTYTVVDNKSGHPIPNATMQIATQEQKTKEMKVIETHLTDKQGSVSIESKTDEMFIRISTETDNTMPYVYTSTNWNRPTEEKKQIYTKLISDRATFRPGQTIYIKGISYWHLPNDSIHTAKNETFNLKLTDPKGEILREKIVKTNDFGSFSTEFLLPIEALNGNYQIKIDNDPIKIGTSLSFRIEEYKLPTFEVTFDKVMVAYAIGDTVTLTGEARSYSGVPIANGKVAYHISLNHEGWLHGWDGVDYKYEEDQGNTTTDEEGRFNIKVHLKEIPNINRFCWWRYDCSITSDVTSTSGESHDANTTLQLRSCPLVLYIKQKDFYNKKGFPHPFTFRVTNLNDELVETQVTYNIYQADESNEQNRNLIYQGSVQSNTSLSLDFLDKLPSAYYIVEATTALEGKTDSTRTNTSFYLFAENETKVPLGKNNWFYWLEDEVDIGEPARLQFGTTEQDAYIMMDVFSENAHIDSRRFYMTDTIQNFTFDYLPQYGNGMHVHVTYVKNGKVYNFSHNINKKRSDRQLELKWETFRNKLTPGTQEEWTLSVNHPDGTTADAELVASMYDAALDKIGIQENWYFPLRRHRIDLYTYWRSLNTRNIGHHIPFDLLTKKIPSNCRYDDILERYYTLPPIGVVTENSAIEKSLGFGSVMAVKGRVAEADVMISENEIMAVYGTKNTEIVSPEPQPQGMLLRENFTETAFFQPHLRTDSTGRVKVCFTLPDNLTRWRFRAFAHTQQMEFGTLEDYATAQRDFMVQPNLPRFIRTGDNTSVSATISNLSEKRTKGTIRLELIDPKTERVILTRKNKFSIDAGKTSTVTFSFTIKNTDVPLPICRIVADGDKFSDGEQHYLPVLTNKVWVTESVPLIVNETDTVVKSLGHLFNQQSPTASNHRLTIEMTGNPIWQVIQALPTIATPTTDDAFAWVTAWYAHRMTSHILQSHPQIKTIFEGWQTEDANKETLWSNLQKNKELKNILLDETPWLTNANDETEQRKQLLHLFDQSKTQQRATYYLEKLSALQNADGGWSWHNGMKSNRYVTTFILELMERAMYLIGSQTGYDIQRMITLATEYLNKELAEEYQHMKDCEKKGEQIYPSELTLTYLGSQALNGKIVDKHTQEIAEYMVNLLPNLLNELTPYGKAKTSIILKHYGKETEVAKFLTSLKEFTTYTPEMGRFFDNPSYTLGWRDQHIPTQVAMIEALTLMKEDSLYIEQMKQWLLIQKRSQSWDNPINSVDAIHALLLQGESLLDTKSHTTIKIDGKEVTSNSLLGSEMNYLQRTYDTNELKHLPTEINIAKTDKGTAWGGVYAQYLEDMSKVTSTYTGYTNTNYGKSLNQPLSIERTWLVQRQVNKQTIWEPITSETTLHVGEKVVSRIIIHANRAMDFVQIKDHRAACTEPTNSSSGYKFNNGIGYYLSVKDASTLYFIDHLPKGTYTFEQTYYIDRTGTYQAGIATVQCAYAPEFVGHSESNRLQVE